MTHRAPFNPAAMVCVLCTDFGQRFIQCAFAAGLGSFESDPLGFSGMWEVGSENHTMPLETSISRSEDCLML